MPQGVDGLTVSETISTAATVVVAVFSVFLWKVNDTLAKIQEEAEKRNSAIVHLADVQVVQTPRSPLGGLRFVILNSGLRTTHIQDAFICYHEGGVWKHERLDFWWHKPDYEGNQLGNEKVVKPIPFHFVAERMESGQLWDIEARPRSGLDLQAVKEGRLVVRTVLGGETRSRFQAPGPSYKGDRLV